MQIRRMRIALGVTAVVAIARLGAGVAVATIPVDHATG
jgi:hypothetical protein